MKYLSDYIQERQTALFNELGVFFAFSNEQFKEGIDKIKQNNILLEGEKVVSIGAGGYVPHKNLDAFLDRHHNIVTEGMEQDVKENTLEGVVLRELGNHEAYYTHDIESTWEAIEGYPGLKKEHIQKLLRNRNYKIDE